MKKPRKPKHLSGGPGDPQIYAGFDEEPDGDLIVYIGGRYYRSSAQIHLTKKDVLRLAPWIAKAAAHLKAKKTNES